MDGILIINKAAGMTSHDVVSYVRRLLLKSGHRVKVGHTGTLDPMATGVLPLCIGRATKVSSYIMAESKAYEALINLGAATDTLDADGKVVDQAAFDMDEAGFRAVVMSFVGDSLQEPPMYSAIKVDGKRLYDLARRGEVVKREPRPITIHNIEIIALNLPHTATIRVFCSKGTYIRSLAADIGLRCGSLAHLGGLCRLSTGQFDLSAAIDLARFEELLYANELHSTIIPIDKALNFEHIQTLPEADKYLTNGNEIPLKFVLSRPKTDKFFVYSHSGRLCGIYKPIEGGLRPLVVL